jgi:hypothetical protein
MATVMLDRVAGGLEVASQGVADQLGVTTLRVRREGHEVGEEDGDQATLGGAGCGARAGGRRPGAG